MHKLQNCIRNNSNRAHFSVSINAMNIYVTCSINFSQNDTLCRYLCHSTHRFRDCNVMWIGIQHWKSATSAIFHVGILEDWELIFIFSIIVLQSLYLEYRWCICVPIYVQWFSAVNWHFTWKNMTLHMIETTAYTPTRLIAVTTIDSLPIEYYSYVTTLS